MCKLVEHAAKVVYLLLPVAPFIQHLCYCNILPSFHNDVCVNEMVDHLVPPLLLLSNTSGGSNRDMIKKQQKKQTKKQDSRTTM